MMGIKKLSILPFLKMLPERIKRIKAFSGSSLPSKDRYTPNRLAKALHPQVQYAKVVKITEEAAGCRRYWLAPDEDKGTTALAWFSAGQYVSVQLQVGSVKLSRPYSLCSAPRQSLEGLYAITVQRVDGGLASQFIHDNWAVGTKVALSAPLGEFTYEPLRDAPTVLAVTGGSGITPIYALAQAIADGDEDADLTILYGTRALSDALFRQELEALCARCSRLKLVHVLSHEKHDGCENGFITAELIRKYAPQGDYSLFICGPQAMRRFLQEQLGHLGLRQKFIRNELFGECMDPGVFPDYPGASRPTFHITVRMAGRTYSVTAPADTTVLRSLENAGIAAPAHCRSGECGWCHSQLLGGQVYIPRSLDGRREADKTYGYFHPCCSFPLSDLTIEVPPVPEY